MKLYLQTLARRHVSDEERDNFYRCMVEDLDRLDGLINQLLDAGRLEDGRIDADREDVALDLLLRDCASTVGLHYRLPAEIFQIELQPCTIRAWRIDLDVLFRNLIDNAVKYAGSEPRVGVQLRRTADGRAIVRISDNGRGIPGRFRRHIFKRFERLGPGVRTRTARHRAGALHRPQHRPAAEGPRPRPRQRQRAPARSSRCSCRVRGRETERKVRSAPERPIEATRPRK